MRTKKIKKVLLLQGGSLSSLAMSLPLVYAVARTHSEVQFTLLVKPSLTAFLVDLPANIEAMTLLMHSGNSPLRSFLRLTRLLRRDSFDAVIDLQSSFFSRLLSFFTTLFKATQRVRKVSVKKADSHSLFDRREEERRNVRKAFERIGLPPIGEVHPISPRYEVSFLQEEMPRGMHGTCRIVVAPLGKSFSPTTAEQITTKQFIQQLLAHFPCCDVAVITHASDSFLADLASSQCSILPTDMLFPVELSLFEGAELVVAPESAYLYEAEMVGTEAYRLPSASSFTKETTETILNIISNKISLKEDSSSK